MAKTQTPKQKIIVLTSALLAAGVEGIKKAFAENADGVAADIIVIADWKDASDKALAELQEKFNALDKDFTTFKETAVDPKELQLKLKALGKELKEKDAELNDALAVNQSLTLEIEQLTTARDAVPKTYKNAFFEVDDVVYGFKMQAIHRDGKKITWEMVMADADLQAELVAKGSSLIYKK